MPLKQLKFILLCIQNMPNNFQALIINKKLYLLQIKLNMLHVCIIIIIENDKKDCFNLWF